MEQLTDLQGLEPALQRIEAWLFEHVLVLSTAGQAAAILAAFILAHFVAPRFQRWLEKLASRRHLELGLTRAGIAAAALSEPIMWLLLLWLSLAVAAKAGWPSDLMRIVASLVTAWVVIRFATQLIRDPTWSKLVAIGAWTLAALNILGLLDDTVALLDGLAITFGDLRYGRRPCCRACSSGASAGCPT
jgi:hypothetical protein